MNDINTYGDLKRAVQIWLNRKDSSTIDNIPMFINFALKQFARGIKLPYYEANIQTTIPDNVTALEIPTNFLSAKHVIVNGIPYNRSDVETFHRLSNKALSPSGNLKPSEDGPGFIQGATTATAHFFTRVGSKLEFLPTLKKGDTVQMIYHKDIPEFTNDLEESYVLMIASDVMLYMSLRHAAIFLRDNEQEQYWNGKAMEALANLQFQLDEAEWSGSSLVVPHFAQ
ncbi:MAG: phage adaptor protein [Cetobacterium sp.]|uniref:phage adaptor protein n=1 Tax=Cetobacterium sp. TaxID=2071632 RepID=UPI003EE7DB01